MPFLHLARAIRFRPRLHTHKSPPLPRRLSRAIVARVRAARPDIAFSSDFIVGFPGESEDDFRATLSLVDEVGLRQRFLFQIQRLGPERRPRTHLTNSRRCQIRAAPPVAGRDRSDSRLRSMRGAVAGIFDVLFEKLGRYPGQIVGRSPYLQPVQVMAPRTMIGEIAPVTVTEVASNSLFGAFAEKGLDTKPILMEA